jgi:hypothetical protein
MNFRRLIVFPYYSITLSARTNKCLRNSHTNRLSGLEVDHQLELGRLLDRYVGDLGATEELDNLWQFPMRRRWRAQGRRDEVCTSFQSAVGSLRALTRS